MGQRWLAASVVGRERELTALLAAVRRPPAAVVVEGEAGVGKTRLVHELSGRLSRTRLLVGHCRPLREPFPFGPLVDALAKAGDDVPALPPITGVLHPLLPELAHRLPAQPPPAGDPGIERHRLFRGFRELLAALGPTVLAVEDVHWVDQGTADLLRFLAEDPPPGLSLVLTVRPEDARAAAETAVAGQLRLPLAPLPVDEVRALAAQILGSDDLGAGFAARLHGRTGGLPFAVEELLRQLPAGAGPAVDRVDWLAVPPVLRDQQRQRLGRLRPAARRIVDAAAVLAVPSREPALTAVAGLAPAAGALAIAEALRQAALCHAVHSPAGEDRYGFRHSLAADAAYEQLASPIRRLLHKRAERVLRDLRPRPLAQLAHHARLGGLPVAARRYAEQAADQAAGLGDNAAATDFLRTALAAPNLPRATRIRLTVKLGRAATLGLAHTEVVPLLREVLHTERLPAGQRGELRLRLGLLLSNQFGDVRTGTDQIRLAAAELRSRPDLAARALAALALPDHTTGPVADNLAALDAAMRTLPQVSDPVVRTAVLVNRASTLLCVGHPAAWQAIDDLPATGRDPAESLQLHRGYCNFVNNCLTLGHYTAAHRFLTRSQEFECAGYTRTLTTQLRMHLDFATGELGSVRRLAGELAATTGLPTVGQDTTMMLAVLRLLRGDAAGAERRIRAACPGSDIELRARSDAMTIAWLVRALVALGRPADAVAEAGPVLAAIRAKGAWVWAAELVPALVPALLDVGGAAADLVAEFASGITDADAPLSDAALAWSRAMLSGTADGYLDAHRRYAALPRPYEAALTAEAAGGAHLPAALDGFDRLGATADANRCRALLRRAGRQVPGRRGRPSYGGALSPRERQVLDLLRLGRTNREIAAELFLSERTVESHVARLPHKLGLRARRELWTTNR